LWRDLERFLKWGKREVKAGSWWGSGVGVWWERGEGRGGVGDTRKGGVEFAEREWSGVEKGEKDWTLRGRSTACSSRASQKRRK